MQHLRGHYKDITIHTAGHNIKNAKGMKADIEIDDVDLHGNADSKGTIGKLDANITWTSDGIQETVQNSLPFIGGLVNSVTTDPSAGTIELTGAMGLGGVTVKPQVADGQLTLQVYKVNALGVLIPHETAQTALNTFTAALLKQYPLGIKADSVQVTNDGVAAHFSTQNASIPPRRTRPLLRACLTRRDATRRATSRSAAGRSAAGPPNRGFPPRRVPRRRRNRRRGTFPSRAAHHSRPRVTYRGRSNPDARPAGRRSTGPPTRATEGLPPNPRPQQPRPPAAARTRT